VKVLAWILILAVTACGAYLETAADTTVINSLPYNVASNTVYRLGSHKIVSATTGLNAGGKVNWSLLASEEGVLDTIVCQGLAINVSGGGDYVKIHNIVIIGDSTKDSACGGAQGGMVKGDISKHIWLDSCDVTGKMMLNRCVYLYAGYGYRIWGGTYEFHANKADRRDQLDGCAIVIGTEADRPPSGDYCDPTELTASIRDVNVWKAPHASIGITGSCMAPWEIVKCSLLVDGWNDWYVFSVDHDTTISKVIDDSHFEINYDLPWQWWHGGCELHVLSGDRYHAGTDTAYALDSTHGSPKDTLYMKTPLTGLKVGDRVRVINTKSSIRTNGDAFGINIGIGGAGSRCDSNWIHSGTAHEGGQGILIQGCKGAAGDSVYYRWNDIDVGNGPHSGSRSGRCRGIYFRFMPSGPSNQVGNEYVAVRNNKTVYRYDTDTATTWIGREAEGLVGYLSADENDYMARAWHNDFTNNTFEGILSGTPSGWYRGLALDYGAVDSATRIDTYFPVSGYNLFKYNHWKDYGSVVGIANMQGCPGNGLLMIGDTIEATIACDSTIRFQQAGAYREHSRNNRLRDCVFLGLANDTAHFSNQSSNDSLGLSVRFERTVTVPVVDASANPVEGADWWVWNAYGDTLASGTTSGTCIIQQPAVYKFRSKDLFPADTYGLSDSLGYNPISVKAKKGNDSTTVTINLSKTVYSDTLVLSATTVASGGLLMWKK
jgi:hypothetical protein